MGSNRNARVLSVFADRDTRARVEGLLNQSLVEISHATNGAMARAMAEVHRFDLIVSQHPLPDLPSSRFFSWLRRLPLSASTPFLFVTPLHFVPELEPVRHQGATVLSLGDPDRVLADTMSRLIHPAPRRRNQLLVETCTHGDLGQVSAIHQSRDLSESGAFLVTRSPHPLGTRLRLKFLTDGGEPPIEIDGEVVRHADPQAEGVSGFGLRFSSFVRDSRERLHALLSSGEATA